MDIVSIVSIVGALASLVGMWVSLRSSRTATQSKNAAQAAATSIALAATAERLKIAQSHIRDIAPEKIGARGMKLGDKLDALRAEFDQALAELTTQGPSANCRALLIDAQQSFNDYCSELPAVVNSEHWHSLQTKLQEAISELNTNAKTL